MNEENNENQLSKYLKKKIMKWAIRILIPTFILVTLFLLTFAALDTVGNKLQEVGSAVAKIFEVNLKEGDEYLGKITINDEQVNKIIDTMKEIGVDLDDLQLMGDDADYNKPEVQQENREALKKYVRKFYEAQATTQTIYLKEGFWKEWFKDKDTYGTVYVYRVNGDKDDGQTAISKDNPGKMLKYKSYDNLKKQAEAKDLDVRNYYSINDKGQLIVPVWTTTSNFSDRNSVDPGGTEIKLKPINYKNAISQYTTSMNFFFYLAMVTRNPEFVSAVADLVRTGEIHITILEKMNRKDETEIYQETKNTWRGPHIVTDMYGVETGEIRYYEPTPKNLKTVTTTTTISISVQPKITYVKTWFCEQSISYRKQDDEPSDSESYYDVSNDPTLEDDTQPPEPDYDETVVWYTNKSREIKTTRTGYQYKEETRTEVKDRTGEVERDSKGNIIKISQGVYDENNNGKVDKGEYINEDSRFIGLIDDYFNIPNTNRYESVGKENLVTGADLLFYLMQKDASLQKLEQIMRYIMYKYTGTDYGVTDFKKIAEYFEIKELSSSSEGDWTGLWNGECTKEEFIQAVQSFNPPNVTGNGGRSCIECYNKYFVANAENFYDICTRIGVDPRFIFCIGIHESYYGTSDIANTKGNFWGWGAVDWDPMGGAHSFSDMSKGIESVSSGLYGWMTNPEVWQYQAIQNMGYDPSTIDGVGALYASDPEWSSKVKYFMQEIFGNTKFSRGDGLAGDMQKRIVEIASSQDTLGCKGGYCQMWVAEVYAKAGQDWVSACCATEAGNKWIVSEDKENIPLGATVYGISVRTIDSVCGQQAGHVGIYIGDGQVASNVGGIRIESLESWIATFSWRGWGWNGGIDYSQQ